MDGKIYDIVSSPLTLVSDDDLLEIAKLVELNFRRYQNKNRCRRSLYHQIALYRKTIRLSNEGLQYFEIGRILGIRSSTVYSWLWGHSPWTIYKLPLTNFGFGYIIGSGIGDGTVIDDGRILIYSWLKDEDFADIIVQYTKQLNINAHKWYKRGWQVAIANVPIAELVWIGKKYPFHLLPIISSEVSVIKGVLNGWFDADGSPGSFSLKCKYDAPHADSLNREIVEVMGVLLDLLGIHYTINRQKTKEFISPQTGKKYKPKSEEIYRLRIRRCCTVKFSREVGFKIRRKKYALDKLIDNTKFKNICQ